MVGDHSLPDGPLQRGPLISSSARFGSVKDSVLDLVGDSVRDSVCESVMDSVRDLWGIL